MPSFPLLEGFTPPEKTPTFSLDEPPHLLALSVQSLPGASPRPCRLPRGRGRRMRGWGGGGGSVPSPPGQPGQGVPGPAGKDEMLAPSGGLPPPAWPQGTRLGEKRAFLGFAQQRSPVAFPRPAGRLPGVPGRCLHRPPPGKAVILPDPRGICSAPPGLSITSRRPQALGTPWGRYGTPPPGRGVLLLHGLRRQSCRFARQK